MTKIIIAAGVLALLTLGTPALAENSSETQAPATKTEDDGQNKVVCRRVESIGTRLAAKKICRTKGEWDAEASSNRQDLERSQTQRWKSD